MERAGVRRARSDPVPVMTASLDPKLATIALYEVSAKRTITPPNLARLLGPDAGGLRVGAQFTHGVGEVVFAPPPGEPPAPGTAHSYQFYPFMTVQLRQEPDEGGDPAHDGQPLWIFEMRYEASYVLAVDAVAPDVEEVGAAVTKRIHHDAWPHFRELLGSLLQRMGLPTIPFPMEPPKSDG